MIKYRNARTLRRPSQSLTVLVIPDHLCTFSAAIEFRVAVAQLTERRIDGRVLLSKWFPAVLACSTSPIGRKSSAMRLWRRLEVCQLHEGGAELSDAVLV